MSEYGHLDYEAHEVFDTPDNPLSRDTKIWRYMDLAKFLSMLESGAINFTRVDYLGDPYEGSSTVATAEAAKTMQFADGKPASHHFKLWREMLSVSCWNQSEVESDGLWNRYVKEGAGLAVQTTVGRMVDAFAAAGPSDPDARTPVYAGRIRYVDYAKADWPMDNVFWPFVHKRLEFEYEREVRVLAMWPPKQFMVDAQAAAEAVHPDKTNVAGAVPPSVTPIARPIAVDLSTLIEEIVVSSNAPAWFLDLLRDVGRRYDLELEPRRSSLAAEPIW